MGRVRHVDVPERIAGVADRQARTTAGAGELLTATTSMRVHRE
jgi:hypothetical protein